MFRLKVSVYLPAEAKFERLLCINKKVMGERDNTHWVCEKKVNERESKGKKFRNKTAQFQNNCLRKFEESNLCMFKKHGISIRQQ